MERDSDSCKSSVSDLISFFFFGADSSSETLTYDWLHGFRHLSMKMKITTTEDPLYIRIGGIMKEGVTSLIYVIK